MIKATTPNEAFKETHKKYYVEIPDSLYEYINNRIVIELASQFTDSIVLIIINLPENLSPEQAYTLKYQYSKAGWMAHTSLKTLTLKYYVK